MFRLLADENLHNGIIRGLLRRDPSLDLARVQDVGLSGADDPDVLDWAARERRVLVPHDVNTITRHPYERVRARQTMAGVIEVRSGASIGQAIEDILLLLQCTAEPDWELQIWYVPL